MDSPRLGFARGGQRGRGGSGPGTPRSDGYKDGRDSPRSIGGYGRGCDSPRSIGGYGRGCDSPSKGSGSSGEYGSGYGGRKEIAKVVFDSRPDPYTKGISKSEFKWKDFPENKEDVKLHQRRAGEKANWKKTEITVAVNHYAIESTKVPGKFPFSSIYHYDITYEINRQPSRSIGEDPQMLLPTFVSLGLGREKNSGRPVAPLTAVVNRQGNRSSPVPGQNKMQANGKLPKHLTSIILELLIPRLRQQFGHHAIATDSAANLYSSKKLEEIGIPRLHEVTFEDLRKAGLFEDSDDATIKVSILPSIAANGKVHVIDTAELHCWYAKNSSSLEGLQMGAELRQTVEAGFNAFVKTMPNFPYYLVGRSSMVPRVGAQEMLLGKGLIARKGITANMTLGWKPYLNVDIANCAFLVGQPVLELLKGVLPRNANDVSRWSTKDFDEAKTLLKTCKVSYTVDNQKRSGPIRDICKTSPATQKFRWAEKNKEVTVQMYYKERYGMILQNPRGPLLEIRKPGVYVPAELCTIKQGQSYNRKLDGEQTTKMLDFAKTSPKESYSAIQTKMNEMNLGQNPVLKDLGVAIGTTMVEMQARVLVPPTIRYGSKPDQTNQVAHISPMDGTWDCWKTGKYDFYQPALVKRWGVMAVGCSRLQEKNDPSLVEFASCLVRNGEKKGIQFKSSPSPVIADLKDRRRCSAKENATDFENLLRLNFSDCDLVICVIPKKGDPVYGHLKHAAEVKVGLLTQCVVEKNVRAAKDATIQNILLKINSKLGGINHVTAPPLDKGLAVQCSSVLHDYPVLILGADVTHAPPGSRKTMDDGSEWIMPSYVAVTGSFARNGMPFMTEVRAQRKANAGAAEVVESQHLTPIVKKMLDFFRVKTGGVYPAKIIYYRDGVGEGQFPEVLHVEMTAIRNACHLVGATYEPKITFITVQKRHKTRIFHKTNSGGIENAPAGTIIDKQIVHATEIDFYLCSHKGLLGTSRPSRYHVLWDDSDFSQDELHSITFLLCFMYARCTKSVKMPAPTYYAHLAADRAKKLCEGLETTFGAPSEENLNKILARDGKFTECYPMHFV